MNCGDVYIRNKKTVLERINNNALKRAYLICENMKIIQGIDKCIECDPEGILVYMNMEKISEC